MSIVYEKYACIIVTTSEWINKAIERGATVLNFPPEKREKKIRNLVEGSICLLYAKDVKAFLGEIGVKEVRRVTHRVFNTRYKDRAIEIEKTPFPKPGERTWIIVFDKITLYPKSVKKEECTDVRALDGKPVSEWPLVGVSLIRPEKTMFIVEKIREKAGLIPPAKCEEVPQEDLIKELIEIGEVLGFIVKADEPTPDGIYKANVTWRITEAQNPSKIFEVSVKRELYSALTKLKHAYDTWGAKHLWLIVCDERDPEKARKVLEAGLKGPFSMIERFIKIKTWLEIHEVYQKLIQYKQILREFSERG